MRKVRQQLGLSATLASLTLVCVMALVIASCSSQSGNPTSPTGLGAPDSQFQGQGHCARRGRAR